MTDTEKVISGNLLAGKRGLIMGVANDKSIAWGIAEAAHAQGAELAYTYQGEVLKKRVEPLAAKTDSHLLYECDVSSESSMDWLFDDLKRKWDRLDFIVHAIAFSNKDELKGKYVDVTLQNFLNTMHISCYSFTAVAKRAAAMMSEGGSMITLTYYGAEKVMPNYNVMGVAKAALEASVKYLAVDLGPNNIRVNAISAGPIRTLAAAGIGDFRYILQWNEYNAPMRRTVTTQEVGKAGVFLLSDLSSATTGQTLYVDAGYNVIGMKAVDAPDISTV
ncbi:MAG: enoyl-ACP reductase FabI [Alphaproteobacteria bacterium]|jgi:enoyl-[acyl-carrier protein] reductase I